MGPLKAVVRPSWGHLRAILGHHEASPERKEWIVKNRLNKELKTAITDTFTEVGATTAITALSSEVV